MVDSRLTISYLSALIRSGGGIRPTEARQPPCCRQSCKGTVPIPLRRVGGDKGRSGAVCPLPFLAWERGFLLGRPRRSSARRNGTALSYARGLVCRECGEMYDLAPLHVCELCFGPLEVAYDYDAIRASISREEIEAGPPTVWRYRKLLPVGDQPLVDIQTGWTPLLKADNLGRLLGLRNLYLKNDTVNPSFS